MALRNLRKTLRSVGLDRNSGAAENDRRHNRNRKILKGWKTLMSVFKRSTDQCHRPAKTEQSYGKILESLPIEILLYIISFLPTSSAAAFTLCSKTTLKSLGPGYFEKLARGNWQLKPVRHNQNVLALTDEQAEWQAFLLLLNKDGNKADFCYLCQKLHNPENAISACREFANKPLQLGVSGHWVNMMLGLNFQRVHAAMRLHHLGHDDRAILHQFSRTNVSYGSKHTCEKIYKARIISDKFYLRVQYWFLLSRKGPRDRLMMYYPWGLGDYVRFGVCRQESYLLGLHSCRFTRHNEVPYSKCFGLNRGGDCFVEFQIDTKDLHDRGLAVVVTEWLDIGECLTPFDPRWICYLPSYPRSQVVDLHAPVGIKQTFEGEEFHFDAHITEKQDKALFIKT